MNPKHKITGVKVRMRWFQDMFSSKQGKRFVDIWHMNTDTQTDHPDSIKKRWERSLIL
jgi:hypothetical protein